MTKKTIINLLVGIIVAIFVGIALYLRIVLPYDKVFVGDWIKFTGTDTYFYMRIVDNLIHNFPNLIGFDPYSLFPNGFAVTVSPFFTYVLAVIIWIIGLGNPSPQIVDIIGVFIPAFLGALLIIPVFFIGKTLFNKWAGLIASGLVAIMPGEFLGRSILGFTDQHVIETLVSTTAMMFLIMAIKSGMERDFKFAHIQHFKWNLAGKPIVLSILAGIFLGTYLIAWPGALMFVFLIFIYVIIQLIIDHLRGKNVEYLGIINGITLVVSVLIFLPTSANTLIVATILIALIVPIVLTIVSYWMKRRQLKPFYYPVAILIFGGISLLLLYLFSPSLFWNMIGRLDIFRWPIGTSNMEMQPMLMPQGEFTWDIAWINFTTGFFISFVSLAILIYLIIKKNESDKLLLVVWSLVILAANLAMRRFAYYYLVNVALLTAYFSWLIIQFLGLRKKQAVTNLPAKKHTDHHKKKAQAAISPSKENGYSRNILGLAAGIVIVYFLVFFPLQGLAATTANQVYFAPSNAWMESLTWMKNNTPEPFNDPDYYYKFYETPKPGETYKYPSTAYGVTAWWDYGYWITRIGRRIPTSNPGTGNTGEASVFMAQDEKTANDLIDKWNSKYLVIDYKIAMVNQKFYALAELSGSTMENYADVFYQQQGTTLQPLIYFYPEYYKTLVVRLYNFNANQIIPQTTTVISYENKKDANGNQYNLITSSQSFTSYEKAAVYLSSQKTGTYKIVSSNPYSSPIPVEALKQYKLVYTSKGTISDPTLGGVAEIKIFEYTK